MSLGFIIFSNIIAPLVTASFFVICVIYFLVASPSDSSSFKPFIVFLISFGLFSLGRPLQLILGPHPMPLIIVNIRVFILCAVVAPSLVSAANMFGNQKLVRQMRVIVVPCIFLGLTYVVFNTLGTDDSYRLFELGSLVGFDNLTPSVLPPFYGREVTIGVQFLTGALLLVISSLNLTRLRPMRRSRILRDKSFLINVGILLFACAFIIGSLARLWWIYYVASILTSLMVGASVLIDAQEVHRYYERLVPFIKEDIIQNVAFSDFSRSKLIQLLDCLGKEAELDTFIVARIKNRGEEQDADFSLADKVIETVTSSLDKLLGNTHFLVIPQSGSRISIILHSPSEWGEAWKDRLLDLLEAVREEVQKKHSCLLSMGIGRRQGRIDDLNVSYHEAISAQEYAEQFEGGTIVHIEDVTESEQPSARYPVREKDRLLSAIRLGDIQESKSALETFIGALRPFMEERPELLRVRLYELIGSIVDAAVLGGGDEESLDRLAGKFAAEVGLIKDIRTAEQWLRHIVSEITGGVIFLRTRRIGSLISQAVSYIHANYAMQLSYKDIARDLGISASYFLNLFKKETGFTFVDYLTMVRIEAAKERLLASDLSITEIAFEVGFNSSNYFSSTFHRITGVSAKTYRSDRPRVQSVLDPRRSRAQGRSD